jgi:hypothetical protein
MKKQVIFFITLFFQLHVSGQFCFNHSDGFSQQVTGNGPMAICKADFNNDGKLEVAVANYTSNNVSVHFFASSGSVTTSNGFGAGTNPISILSRDFNNDGNADIAVSNSGSDNISVLLGNGSGSFSAATNFSVGSNPRSITSADFNLDGYSDLAVVNYSSNSVSLLLGNGAGTFTANTSFITGSNPISVISPDLNNDGKPDLLIANYTSKSLSVLVGTGTGSFTTSTYTLGTLPPNSLSSADFNGDSKKDVVVTFETNHSYYGYNVSVLAGNGLGSFTSTVNYAAGVIPNSSLSEDLNGDGTMDIAIVDIAYNDVSLFFGNGTGTFTYDGACMAQKFCSEAVTGDFNNDGKKDMVVANSASNSLSILLGNGAGAYGGSKNYNGEYSVHRVIKTADFNSDGRKDIAFVNWVGYMNPSVEVHFGNGNGSFSLAGKTFFSTSINDIEPNDYNSDGKTDLAVATATGITILPGTGTGSFLAATSYSNLSIQSIVSGDYNNDGKVDLAVTAGSTAWFVQIFLGSGTGSFTQLATYPISPPFEMLTTDFNNDGNLDLATCNVYSVAVLLGNGTGNFSGPSYFNCSTANGGITSADFNGDGNKDLATAYWSNVSILLGSGTGSFTNTSNYFTGIGLTDCSAADLNLDSQADLVVSDGSNDRLYLFKGSGLGTFTQSPASLLVMDDPVGVFATDLNSDNLPDIITSNYSSSNISVMLNQTSAIIGTPVAICSGSPAILKAPKGAYSYYWTPGGSTADSLIVTFAGTYSLSMNTLVGNCNTTSAITVTSATNPVVAAMSNNTLICSGQTATLTASGANTFTWNTGATGSTVAVSPTVNTTYSVTGTDLNGCKNGASITQSVSTCAGISELEHTNALSILPNPNNGEFILRQVGHQAQGTIEIFNARGESVMTTPLVERETKIDLREFEDGFYFVRIKSGNEMLTKKIIKQ